MGACPHLMGGLVGLWNGTPSLEKNHNFTSTWNVLIRYLLNVIIIILAVLLNAYTRTQLE